MCVGDELSVEINLEQKYKDPEGRYLHGCKLSDGVAGGKFTKEKQWQSQAKLWGILM